MISNKRLAKIKKEIEKTNGKLTIIQFADGNELKVKPMAILDSLTKFVGNKDQEENQLANDIKGKEIVSCSGSKMLVSILKQLAEHDTNK